PPPTSTLFPYTTLFRSHHPGRFVPNDARLVPFRGRRVYLGARLAVGVEHVEPDTGRLGGLAVFPGHLVVGDAEPSRHLAGVRIRSEEHTSELQSRENLV